MSQIITLYNFTISLSRLFYQAKKSSIKSFYSKRDKHSFFPFFSKSSSTANLLTLLTFKSTRRRLFNCQFVHLICINNSFQFSSSYFQAERYLNWHIYTEINFNLMSFFLISRLHICYLTSFSIFHGVNENPRKISICDLSACVLLFQMH